VTAWIFIGFQNLRSINSLILFGVRQNCLIIIEPLHKKGDETDCNNYHGISLLSSSCKILFNNLLSRLTLHTYEIIGDHQCRFQFNRSTMDGNFCIHQILEKKWEYNETVHQLFIDFKKACDSVRTEVLYNILIEFWLPMKLVKRIKMHSNETYSEVHVHKHLSDSFPILKQGNSIRKVQENQVRLKLNETDQLLANADDVNLLGDIMGWSRYKYIEKTKYMLLSCHQNAGQNWDIIITTNTV
jgi:hypothetical protein